MPRRVTLVALWAVFAVASVSVGFAAAGLVSDPFTAVGTSTDVSNLAGPGDVPVTEPAAGPDGRATGTAAPSTRTPAPGTPTQQPTRSGATRSADPTKSSSSRAPAQSTVNGGIPTRGGYVSGTCRGGLVSVGAAPAVYWQVTSRTPGRVRTAEVRLEPAQDAHGERVEVTVTCVGGAPAFHTDYSDGGGDGGGGDGGGGDDSGGSGGSGGSDD